MRAKKRFGQHFLIDQEIISRILHSVQTGPEDEVVEIGPGRGALTEQLVRSGCNLTLVEIDRELSARLGKRYPAVNLINQDMLKVDLADLANGQTLRVIGNLPYNISTPLLFRLFHQLASIRDMHFMLQLEVADRMTAQASCASYGRLSIMTQLHCQVEKLFQVPPEAFSPRPRVQSALIRLKPHPLPENLDIKLMGGLLAQVFSARRKNLRNAMKGLLTTEDLAALSLAPDLRPENLSVTDYIRCTKLLAGKS